MEVKLIELRDRATFIPMVAMKLEPRSESERWLAARAGFGSLPDQQRQYVFLGRLDCSVPMQCDPYGWPESRTYMQAHVWLINHWDEIESGSVLDVEFILGESDTKKMTERQGPCLPTEANPYRYGGS